MSGSKTNTTNREEILTALRKAGPDGDYLWDGSDEDDRPSTAEELRAGIEEYRRTCGRPQGSGTKEQVSIRLDQATLRALRATGRGWQTRINDALATWLKSHSPDEIRR